MPSKDLSTEIITHKLKIKGEGIRYISNKLAENIFYQLADDTKSTITIANPKTLTYITKYKSEVDLIKLDSDNSDFEDALYMNGLTEYQKEKVREIWELRKKNKQSRNKGNLEIIIQKVKSGEI